MELSYNNNKISIEFKVISLGLIIDDRPGWGPHIDKIMSKVNKYVFALRMLTVNVTRETAQLLYFSQVQSRISYGIMFWDKSVHASRIRILQKTIRVIYELRKCIVVGKFLQ